MPKTSQAILLTGGDPAGISPEIIPPAIRYWKDHAPADTPLVYFCTAGQAHIDSLASEFSPVEIIRDRSVSKYIDETQKKRPPLAQAQNTGASFWGGKGLLVFDLPSLLPLYMDLQVFRSSYIGSNTRKDSGRSSQQLGMTPSTAIQSSPASSPPPSKPGSPDTTTGLLALFALEEACRWIEELGCLGLVTAPLSKEHVDAACQKLGRATFHGHTGFLAKRFSCEVAMLMHGPNFSVLPLTTHIALGEVPKALQKGLADPALEKLLKKICSFSVFANKKVALCALNPHGGEGGLMGTEELDFLSNWAKKMQNQGIPIEGPLAADGLFIESVRQNYRLILACYHDQGLIPFKAIEGAEGVNVTIGLPFLRTSPDHGTAFGIAGRGVADPTSIVRALALLLSEELSCA